ncbi:MAG: STAS domain-containing protein [bacterium]|nr:STAS domain-containing protein [bacterium]
MDIRELTTGEIAVLKAKGALDRMSAGRLGHGIRAAVNRGCRKIVLNLSEIESADSRGLGELLFSCSQSWNQGREILIAQPPPFLRELLLSSNMVPDHIVCDSLYEALRSARDSAPL